MQISECKNCNRKVYLHKDPHNRMCKSCNKAMGLRECKECKETLIINLNFQGERAKCKKCRKVKPKGRPRKLSQNKMDQIVLLYQNSNSIRKIASLFKTNYSNIYRILEFKKVKRRSNLDSKPILSTGVKS